MNIAFNRQMNKKRQEKKMNGINVRHKIHTVPMLRYSVLLIIGIFLGDSMSGVVSGRGWLLLLCALTLGAMMSNKKFAEISSVLILCAVVVVGAFRITFDHASIYNIGKEGEDFGLKGVGCKMVVMSDPRVRGKVLHFDAIVYDSGLEYVKDAKVRVSMLRDTITGKYKDVRLGDVIDAAVDLSGLKGWHRQNKHFDYVRWQRSRNFKYRAFVPIGKWKKSEASWDEVGILNMLQVKMLMMRAKVLDKMKSNLTDNAYSIATAMSLGNKASLTPEMREEYSISGASHVLALSGMHLSIIYMLLRYILGRRTVGKRMAMLMFVWTYILFAGLPISMIRAGLMLTLWEIIDLLQESQKPMNILGMAAFVMLMFNPQCLWDVGFEMSFMAVLSIMSFSDLMKRMTPELLKRQSRKKEHEMPAWWLYCRWPFMILWQAMTISIAAQVGTIPLTVYYFGRVSLFFVIANVIVVAFAAVIVGLALTMVLLYVFDLVLGIEGGMSTCLLGKVLTLIVETFHSGITWVANLPGASIENVEINVLQLLALYGVLLVMVLWANRKRATGLSL